MQKQPFLVLRLVWVAVCSLVVAYAQGSSVLSYTWIVLRRNYSIRR